ncbi:MAG: asparagine synthetase B [Candidatus Rokubacteria bacterium]|nr:asparagine synthetase B [Candidatus Rokubacteria bacterium]
MCGIAATTGIADAAVFDALFAPLRHRGPDGSHRLEDRGVRLGCHRLAIVDPVGGRQPLMSADGRWVLVFNGEIYNHRALREQFRRYAFRTETDGEVLFPLIAEAGPQGLSRARGMFAFVLVDLASGGFIAARDPLGIKPLYVMTLGDGYAFASEMKAFAGLDGPLRFVPPGHYLTRHGLRRYYRPPPRRRRHAPLRRLLEEAVRTHLPPHGPCGVLLSGGVDSSAVAAIAARLRPDVTAYTIALEGAPDSGAAAEVAAHLGIRHVLIKATAREAREAIAATIWHLENHHPWMVRNALPLFLLSRYARAETKVVLGGDGADELFGGYDYLAALAPRAWPQALEAGINDLHRTELQRVDRATMAHGVELRVPFLDLPVVEHAIDVPVSAKIRRSGDRRVTKWALRTAVADLLPPSICWREKTPFATGSGFAALPLFTDGVEEDGVDAPRDAEACRQLWEARFSRRAATDRIWADAARFTDFSERYGTPLLDLFRR